MPKTNSNTNYVIQPVTVYPVQCYKGHLFYPKIQANGTITKPTRCIFRHCRVYLDNKKIENGLKKRQLNLQLHGKNPIKIHKTKIGDQYTTKTVQLIERPFCNICNLTFYDIKNFKFHNKRLHKQP